MAPQTPPTSQSFQSGPSLLPGFSTPTRQANNTALRRPPGPPILNRIIPCRPPSSSEFPNPRLHRSEFSRIPIPARYVRALSQHRSSIPTSLSPLVQAPAVTVTSTEIELTRDATLPALANTCSTARPLIFRFDRANPTNSLLPPAVLQARPRPLPVRNAGYISSQKQQSQMRIFQQANHLFAKIDILYDQDATVNMQGGLGTATQYSLPGHVILTLPSLPSSLAGRVREIQSLTLKVEGRSEFFKSDGGYYTPMRLFSDNIILASPEKTLLVPSHDPTRPRSQSIRLAVPFDLRLPGWLPMTIFTFLSLTAYGAKASVRIGWIAGTDPKTLHRLGMGNPSLETAASFRSHSRFAEFKICRHNLQCGVDGQAVRQGTRTYTLIAKETTNPVDCLVSVPDWVDTNGSEKSLCVSIHIRTKKAGQNPQPVRIDENVATPDSSEAASSVQVEEPEESGGVSPVNYPVSHQCECPKHMPPSKEEETAVSLTEIAMEVDEVERYSSVPFTAYTRCFPIPNEQPSVHHSQHALISPRNAYGEACSSKNAAIFTGHRARKCLLAANGQRRNFVFAEEGLSLAETWRKINVILPMPDELDTGDFKAGGRPQSDYDSPFLRIKQILRVRMGIRLGGELQDLLITVPIRFGTCLQTLPNRDVKQPILPPYVQIFHENGDLRETDPVPKYTPCVMDLLLGGLPPSYENISSEPPSPSSSRSSSPTLSSSPSSSLRTSSSMSSVASAMGSLDLNTSSDGSWSDVPVETPKRRALRAAIVQA